MIQAWLTVFSSSASSPPTLNNYTKLKDDTHTRPPIASQESEFVDVVTKWLDESDVARRRGRYEGEVHSARNLGPSHQEPFPVVVVVVVLLLLLLLLSRAPVHTHFPVFGKAVDILCCLSYVCVCQHARPPTYVSAACVFRAAGDLRDGSPRKRLHADMAQFFEMAEHTDVHFIQSSGITGAALLLALFAHAKQKAPELAARAAADLQPVEDCALWRAGLPEATGEERAKALANVRDSIYDPRLPYFWPAVNIALHRPAECNAALARMVQVLELLVTFPSAEDRYSLSEWRARPMRAFAWPVRRLR